MFYPHASSRRSPGITGGCRGVVTGFALLFELRNTSVQSVFAVKVIRRVRVRMAPTVIVMPVSPSKKKL